MRGVGRSLLLTLFLAVAVVALVVLVAALQAPVPGGGSPGDVRDVSGGAPGSGSSGEGEGDTEGSGISEGDNAIGEGRPIRAEPCEEESGGGSPSPTSASMLVLAPVPLGRSRRLRLLGLVGLAAVGSGCFFGDDCVSAKSDGGGGGGSGGGGSGAGSGFGGGGGGTGGGSGSGDGPGTGRGTEPDPVTFDPKALWIILLVLGVLVVAALLASAFASRGGKSRRLKGENAAQAAIEVEQGEASREARDVLAGMPEGNARAVVAAYVEACGALARRGVWRRSPETARELAQRAPEGCRDAMSRLTGLYEAARHGGVQPSDEAVRQARALAQAVAAEAARAPEPEVVQAGGR